MTTTRRSQVWARPLGVERAIVEDVELEEVTGALVFRIRLRQEARDRIVVELVPRIPGP